MLTLRSDLPYLVSVLNGSRGNKGDRKVGGSGFAPAPEADAKKPQSAKLVIMSTRGRRFLQSLALPWELQNTHKTKALLVAVMGKLEGNINIINISIGIFHMNIF